jgi:DNA-binding transcriptional regulator YdaS (Cro superfamily)
MNEAAVIRAISAAGGVAKLAAAVGVTHPSIIGWRRRGEIPLERLQAVSAATGIPALELRPDLAAAFQPSPSEAA